MNLRAKRVHHFVIFYGIQGYGVRFFLIPFISLTLKQNVEILDYSLLRVRHLELFFWFGLLAQL